MVLVLELIEFLFGKYPGEELIFDEILK